MTELPAHLVVLLIAGVGVVALLYSSVGHGGATGYLALMSLLGVSASLAQPGALWMNCGVSAIAFWRFRAAGHFDASLFLPLAGASVPLAWLGSRVQLEGRTYAVILGVTLAAAGWLLGWGRRPAAETARPRAPWPLLVVTGAALGCLAGLTGIGGGVFLTPLLILLHATPAKTAGGLSALFILVNSAAGLVGLGSHALVWQPAFTGAVLAGAGGALLGTHLGVRRWPLTAFRRVLALVLWIAAGRLLLTGH
jgi:hypothetical protein